MVTPTDPMVERVERQTFAPKVAGSSPTGTLCDRRGEKTISGLFFQLNRVGSKMPASTLTHARGFCMSIGMGMGIGDSEPAPILKAKKKKRKGMDTRTLTQSARGLA